MIWIIGTGYLGSRLAAALRREQQNLLCIDIQSPLADARIDAANAAQMDALLAEHGAPHLIISCCATKGGDLPDYHHCYLDLQRNLARLCEKMPHKPQLIFCSSSSVYGGGNGEEISEQSPPKARHPRAQILLDSEAIVLAQGGIVLRLAALYGKERCALLYRFLAGEMPIAGDDSRQLNYLYVDGAVRQISQLIAELKGLKYIDLKRKSSDLLSTENELFELSSQAAQIAPQAIYNLLSDQFRKGEILAYLAARTGRAIPLGKAPASKRGSSNQRLLSSLALAQDARSYTTFRNFVDAEFAEFSSAKLPTLRLIPSFNSKNP